MTHILMIQMTESSQVNQHNDKRQLHQDTPDVKWNSTIAKNEQDQADALAKKFQLISHSLDDSSKKTQYRDSIGGIQYGENIGYVMGSSDLGKRIDTTMDAWYGEIKNYNYNDPKLTSDSGHFTQVVWKDSTEIGCGQATCGDKKYYVCQYKPAGNYSSRFEDNVKPLKK